MAGALLERFAQWRVAEKMRELGPLLRPGERILDVGSGSGVLCRALRAAGYAVVPLDVRDGSFGPDARPMLYDGVRMPFRDDEFDVSLLITSLHHMRDPDSVLAEARRVSRRLIIIEELVTSVFDRIPTYAIDSVFNLEFFGHPRSNRDDAGWRESFRRLALSVDSAVHTRSLGVLRRVTYVVSRTAAPA